MASQHQSAKNKPRPAELRANRNGAQREGVARAQRLRRTGDNINKKGGSHMKNIEIKTEGSILTIKCDLSKTFGASKSGKSILIASTEGNQSVSPGVMAGINIYKPA